LSSWTVLPVAQPRFRGAPEVMSQQRAAELLSHADASLVTTQEHRFGTVPGGAIVLEGLIRGTPFDEAAEVVLLAGPLMARLASLEESWNANERLTQQRERLTLMVDSLPDPVVITNAANDIITQ